MTTNYVGQRLVFANSFNQKIKKDLTMTNGDRYKIIGQSDSEFKIRDDFSNEGWLNQSLFKLEKPIE